MYLLLTYFLSPLAPPWRVVGMLYFLSFINAIDFKCVYATVLLIDINPLKPKLV
jgi:hypothetical protein